MADSRTRTNQIGVFEAAALDGKGAQTAQAPSSARGEAFAGPAVSSRQYALGEAVAIGIARLRSEVAAGGR